MSDLCTFNLIGRLSLDSCLGGAVVGRRIRASKDRWFDSRPGHYQVN